MRLTDNARRILELRYLRKNDKGEVIESPEEMFERVAEYVGQNESLETRRDFYEMMNYLDFLPNSPCLFNAGLDYPQLAACFVLPMEDSIDGIFTSLHQAAVIAKMGGGVGFNFSPLRPRGAMVKTIQGAASGPLGFMRLFNAMAEVVSQGRRRLAQMAIMNYDHPDIADFVRAKKEDGKYSNFNFSVLVDDEFMENPSTLFDDIVAAAWASGEPGLLFKSRINKDNPTPHLGEIVATNPCAESPLLAYEACNLGSINLSRMVLGGEISWDKLKTVVHLAVHFLDNVVHRSIYPFSEIREAVLRTRKIGLGVMGLADMFIQLGIRYGSEESFEIAEKVIRFICESAWETSIEMGNVRGVFPAFYDDGMWVERIPIVDGLWAYPRRNAVVTSIAPTGTLSLIANCSSGIEPIFSRKYIRHTYHGSLNCKHPIDIDRDDYVVTAHELSPERHVRMQAIFQKYVDLGVSKTVNLPEHAEPDDVARIFTLAHKLGCKGITVYRDNSRSTQVLYRD